MNCEEKLNKLKIEYQEFIRELDVEELREMLSCSKSVWYHLQKECFFLFPSTKNPNFHSIPALIVEDFAGGTIDQYPCDDDGYPIIEDEDCEDLREEMLQTGPCLIDSLIAQLEAEPFS